MKHQRRLRTLDSSMLCSAVCAQRTCEPFAPVSSSLSRSCHCWHASVHDSGATRTIVVWWPRDPNSPDMVMFQSGEHFMRIYSSTGCGRDGLDRSSILDLVHLDTSVTIVLDSCSQTSRMHRSPSCPKHYSGLRVSKASTFRE